MPWSNVSNLRKLSSLMLVWSPLKASSVWIVKLELSKVLELVYL
jgi:hypothetical protein